MNIDDINFAQLYRQQMQASARKPKPASRWDRRAEKMAQHCADPNDPYLIKFVSMMDLANAKTILDIGCGPGTICLALADRMTQVYGLDYSAGMLNVAKKRAQQRGLTNVTLIQRAWQDNWDDVPQCDIVVASRSTLVDDMADAMGKLNEKARLRVYTTHTVSPYFNDPDILTALGRPMEALPNYIYAVNILYQMGIHPQLSYIHSANCQAKVDSFESFMSRMTGAIDNLTDEEKDKLFHYYQQRKNMPGGVITPQRSWAFISWEKSINQ